MRDVDRLLAWFETGELVRPDPSRPNTVDLARALASLVGVELERDAGTRRLAGIIGEADHYVFVLVDGLGMHLLELMPERAFLRSYLALELQAVFPATTAAALSTLATGLWPAQHGLLAWWLYLAQRDLSATVLPFIERFSERPLQEFGIPPDEVFVEPPLLTRARLDTQVLMPNGIADSAFTRYSAGGKPVRGFETLGDAVEAALERIEHAPQPTYTHIYYPRLDALQHRLGPEAVEVRRHLGGVDRDLRRLADGLRGRGRLVVSADHGLLSVADEHKHGVGPDDPLIDLLVAPPAGEPRVPFLHVRRGCTDSVRRAFEQRFGGSFALLAVDEVEELELFGPGRLSHNARSRVGHLIGLTARPQALVYDPARPGSAAEMRGFHGGCSPAEMRIPLIVA